MRPDRLLFSRKEASSLPENVGYCGCGRRFHKFIGVDYSGAGSPDKPQPGLAVALASGSASPRVIVGPHRGGRWSRLRLHQWLTAFLNDHPGTIAGLDLALGMPWGWMRNRGLRSWSAVLRWALADLRTDRRTVREARAHLQFPPAAGGWRLCDRRAPGAKSLFHFDVPGSVASSTLAGLPWIARLRKQRLGIHFWPFDGWEPPPGRNVVAEVFPSLWRCVPSPPGLGVHERDAWLISRWLQHTCTTGRIGAFFHPDLSPAQRAIARREGWILGCAYSSFQKLFPESALGGND